MTRRTENDGELLECTSCHTLLVYGAFNRLATSPTNRSYACRRCTNVKRRTAYAARRTQ